MNLAAAISLRCGGPGSGRHPEFGAFSKARVLKDTFGKMHEYRATNGSQVFVHRHGKDLMTIHEAGMWRTGHGDERTSSQQVYNGNVEGGKKVLSDRYMISFKGK
jgi:hypothetical protein